MATSEISVTSVRSTKDMFQLFDVQLQRQALKHGVFHRQIYLYICMTCFNMLLWFWVIAQVLIDVPNLFGPQCDSEY